jgi:hypothetical protein
MTFQRRNNDCIECRIQSRSGARFIALDQTRITDNIGSKYRCKPTFNSFFCHARHPVRLSSTNTNTAKRLECTYLLIEQFFVGGLSPAVAPVGAAAIDPIGSAPNVTDVACSANSSWAPHLPFAAPRTKRWHPNLPHSLSLKKCYPRPKPLKRARRDERFPPRTYAARPPEPAIRAGLALHAAGI